MTAMTNRTWENLSVRFSDVYYGACSTTVTVAARRCFPIRPLRWQDCLLAEADIAARTGKLSAD